MRKVGLLVVVALGLLAFSGGANAFAQGTTAQNTTLTITMNAQNDSGESGTATLSEQNGQLVVTVNLQNGTSAPQPAHIHKGTCATLDPVPFIPLTSVVNGQATTTIDLSTNATVKSLADLTSGQYAINVHKSATEAKTYVSCGDIVNMQMGGGAGTGTTSGNTLRVQMNAQNDSGQNGTATLTEQNGKLVVSVNISGGSDTAQPAHIHKGTCANLDPKPAYPLTSLVNGTSETTLDLSLATLESGQYAINVHKSAAEVKTYVSCGDIALMTISAGGGTGAAPTATPVTAEPAGMPRTGEGDQSLPFLVALMLVAATMLGTGLRLSRRKA